MKTISYLFVTALLLISCKQNTQKQSKEKSEPVAEQTQEKQSQDSWEILFDGSNFDAWHMYNTGEPVSDAWSIEDGAMVLTPGDLAGNIVTKKEYTNFVLSLDWKISQGGNSGIFWGVIEDEKFSEPYQTGPEIQVLDDQRHPDAKAGTTHQSGALYDMIAPSEKVAKPAGEWNNCVIEINHNTNKGSVTLNGTKVVEFPVHGPEWEAMIADSKFKGWEGFGAYKTGKIGLQYHGDKVSFRNIKIKELAK
ncbi:DUF1080 domain-containing protein [Galbibacter sp.]|uniref:3-keto-disaccharide hydrolase n=1 Tax=Galbibacter sp. TaxID=2918471 RepID=UPI002D1990EA|nr:DUF1080 domain-containing protein [Galbibacter sp.]HLV63315.1 DUF1080 domain-containing protein [Galbibacter sp.]